MRITGGEHRSRILVAPRGQETRPTSDRVREALFSMLASDGVFDETAPRVLDLYAGSGALGLEALSRGAREAVFVESARPALAAIRGNVQSLAVDARATILAQRVERALDLVTGTFDLILVDPPYAEVRLPGFTAVLQKSARRLAASGILTLEHDVADTPQLPDELVFDRQRRYGDTSLSLYRPRFRILAPSSP
jgi:16S rRNA (guanine966-N2)-methyltransferase